MNFKRLIKSTVGAVCASPMFRTHVSSVARQSFNIGYYHRIGPRVPYYQAFFSGCSLAKFEKDLQDLSRVFDFAPLGEVLASKRSGSRRPLMALTFDDGFDLFRDGLMDVMSRHRISATTFVITSCIGNNRLMWRHALSTIQALVEENVLLDAYNQIAKRETLPLLESKHSLMRQTGCWDMSRKDTLVAELWSRCPLPPIAEYLASARPYFDWNQLKQWIQAGHSVGFHTHTHPYCSRLNRFNLDTEIIRPAQELKTRLGVEKVSLSYPFGDRLPPSFELELFEAGLFDSFLGIHGARPLGSPAFSLERFAIEGTSVGWAVFAPYLLQYFRPAATVRQTSGPASAR